MNSLYVQHLHNNRHQFVRRIFYTLYAYVYITYGPFLCFFNFVSHFCILVGLNKIVHQTLQPLNEQASSQLTIQNVLTVHKQNIHNRLKVAQLHLKPLSFIFFRSLAVFKGALLFHLFYFTLFSTGSETVFSEHLTPPLLSFVTDSVCDVHLQDLKAQ